MLIPLFGRLLMVVSLLEGFLDGVCNFFFIKGLAETRWSCTRTCPNPHQPSTLNPKQSCTRMCTDDGLFGFGVQLSTAGTKILVSNLGPEVTDEDLEELFQEHGGPIKKAEIFYKQDGTSSGQGEVIFKRRADADKVPICLPCLRPSRSASANAMGRRTHLHKLANIRKF
jgi:hypothetical protein